MLKVTGMDGSVAWINPHYVVSVSPVREEGGVPLLGACAVVLLNAAPIVTRCGVDEMAEKVAGASRGAGPRLVL